MPENADIDERVADTVDRSVGTCGAELQICAGGLEEVRREHGILIVVAVERDPEEGRLGEE